MRELMKLLDENLEYESHESSGGTLYIYVVSSRKEAACPNCGMPSDKVYSWYNRRFKDLPIQSMKHSCKELMFAKRADDLDLWINNVREYGIEEIHGFLNGITRDLTAVKTLSDMNTTMA